jgi:phosphonoacetaldehyde hydrolase
MYHRLVKYAIPKKITTVVFNCAGTTLDSMCLTRTIALQEVFKKNNVPISLNEAKKQMGLRNDLHILEILKEDSVSQRWSSHYGRSPSYLDIETLMDDYQLMQLNILKKYLKLIPRTKETIEILKNDLNMKIGLTTIYDKKTSMIMEKLLHKKNIKFDSIVSIDYVKNEYPIHIYSNPMNLYKTCTNLNVLSIDNVIKVDSTIVGIGEGINAGCWAVGLYGNSSYVNINSFEHLNTLSSKEIEFKQHQAMVKMIDSGAHFLAPDISYLPNICKNINNRMKRGETPQGMEQQVRFLNNSGDTPLAPN